MCKINIEIIENLSQKLREKNRTLLISSHYIAFSTNIKLPVYSINPAISDNKTQCYALQNTNRTTKARPTLLVSSRPSTEHGQH